MKIRIALCFLAISFVFMAPAFAGQETPRIKFTYIEYIQHAYASIRVNGSLVNLKALEEAVVEKNVLKLRVFDNSGVYEFRAENVDVFIKLDLPGTFIYLYGSYRIDRVVVFVSKPIHRQEWLKTLGQVDPTPYYPKDIFPSVKE